MAALNSSSDDSTAGAFFLRAGAVAVAAFLDAGLGAAAAAAGAGLDLEGPAADLEEAAETTRDLGAGLGRAADDARERGTR